MYKRYYDGYTADNDALSTDSSLNNSDTAIANHGDIIPSDDVKTVSCDAGNIDISTTGLFNDRGFNLGGMQTDDLILAGLLILLLFDSDNVDMTLLIIIGVIFLAGLNI